MDLTERLNWISEQEYERRLRSDEVAVLRNVATVEALAKESDAIPEFEVDWDAMVDEAIRLCTPVIPATEQNPIDGPVDETPENGDEA